MRKSSLIFYFTRVFEFAKAEQLLYMFKRSSLFFFLVTLEIFQIRREFFFVVNQNVSIRFLVVIVFFSFDLSDFPDKTGVLLYS